MSGKRGPSRRAILAGAAVSGGALALGIGPDGIVSGANAQRPAGVPPPAPVTAWLLIHADDRVVVRIARSELGQGTATGLAQLVAEELRCAWSRVQIEMVEPGASRAQGRVWGDFGTTASRGVRNSQDDMRVAAASARTMLLQAASATWDVPVKDLEVDAGVVRHPPTRRAITYGRLAPMAAKYPLPDPRTVKFREPRDWTVAGTAVKPFGLKEKLSGRAVYGIDVRLPGMLCAAIKDSPRIGAWLESFDAAAIANRPGVQNVVRVGDTAVAVVADTWWQAKTALDALPAVWRDAEGPAVDSAEIDRQLRSGLEATEALVGTTFGDALKALRGSAKRVEAVYAVPFVHHATLEPMSATALWTQERVEVWAATQNAEGALHAVAVAAGHPIERAEIHRTLSGGAFGRRARSDYIEQAVKIARQIPGRPIKLIWSRAEDSAHGHFRPISQAKLVGGIDDKGELQGLIVRIAGPSIIAASNPRGSNRGRDPRVFQGLHVEAGEAQMGYSVPNLYIDHALRGTRVPIGSWRGVYVNANAIYLECFVDELAAAAKRDPYQFRRGMMKAHARHRLVLTVAAEKAGWGTPMPAGSGRGIAQANAFGSYAAAVAEVRVDDAGAVKVTRILVALDCGHVVNPDLVNAQIEGQVAFGLSTVFHQETTVEQGRIVERDFDRFPVLRLDEMPQVETLLVPSGEFWGGVGEAAIAVVAPAVLNAIFAATGKRIRRLPLKGPIVK